MKKFEYDFPRPSIATDIAIFTIKDEALSVVLIERKEEPLGWALPGGFLRPDENLDDCAKRETEEETGVDPQSLFTLALLVSLVGIRERGLYQWDTSH